MNKKLANALRVCADICYYSNQSLASIAERLDPRMPDFYDQINAVPNAKMRVQNLKTGEQN